MELIFPLFLFIHERVSSQLQLSIIDMGNYRKKKVSNAERGTKPQKVNLNQTKQMFLLWSNVAICNGIIEPINVENGLFELFWDQ